MRHWALPSFHAGQTSADTRSPTTTHVAFGQAVMKLLHCRRCGDVRALRPKEWVLCSCGASRGMYHGDGLNAVFDGEWVVMLGFANRAVDLAIALEDTDLRDGVERKWGHRFEAFVIPWSAPTVTRPVRCPCMQHALWATSAMPPVSCPCSRFTLGGPRRGQFSRVEAGDLDPPVDESIDQPGLK